MAKDIGISNGLSTEFHAKIGGKFILGSGFAYIDTKECLIVNSINPKETEMIANRCYSFIQLLKNLDVLRDHICNK